jgi:Fe-S cluster assembly protein SufD
MSTIDIQQERSLELPAIFDTDPEWLRDARRASLNAYNTAPVPQRGLHLWRYTDPAHFLIEDTGPSEMSFIRNHVAVDEALAKEVFDGRLDGGAVELGGRRLCYHISDHLAAYGGILAPMTQAIKHHESKVREYLYRLVNEKVGIFEALNGALWEDGIFIYVPDDTIVENPIHIRHEASVGGGRQFHRVLAVIGNNSEVSIIDEYDGGSEKAEEHGYTNSAVEIFGGRDSRVRYVSLQQQSRGITSYLTQRARIAGGGNIQTIPLVFGGALSKQNFGITLDGAGAESAIYGLLFGSGRQRFDNHTLHHHASRQTSSNIDFKVVLRDRAQSAYTGLIRIEHNAPTCQAYQENRNLLLNKGAKADTIPELEILNEDVSCTHGATVGPIDPEMVFYLTSRGMMSDEAVRMVVSGFVAKTLARMPEKLKDRIEGFVTRRLEGI